MKKIKLLLLGIVAFLGIGFSFASTGINSTFSYIDGNNHTFTNLNGMNSRLMYNYIGFDWFSSGSKFIQINSFNASSYTGVYRSFFSSNGIKLNYYNDSNIFFDIGTINQTLLFTQQSDYLTFDGFPLVYDSVGNYLTFSGDNEIIYNGLSKSISNVNFLHYCFYGTDFNLSCLFSTNSTDYGYKFKSFNVINNDIVEYNDFAIIPVHSSITNTGVGYFSGDITLVLAYGNYNNNQNQGIIYNLFNCYSSDFDVLSSCRLNSKGFIDLSSFSFFHRNFIFSLSSDSSINSLLLGTFGEIIEIGGNFYFRNNSSLYNYGSQSTTTSNIPKNCYNYNNCFMQGELPLQNDNSVVDILNNVEPENNTFSGTINFPTCVNSQMCTYYTGSDGITQIVSCTTFCLESGDLQPDGSYIDVLGNIYYVDSSYNVGNISIPDGTIYDTGFLDEDGMLLIDYYSGLFNGNGFKFGVCPYPASDYLNFATKIKLGNFYPFMPLNCFISAFQQGVKVHYFDDSGLFPDNHSQLMAGDSHYHRTLFRFFDVLLSIGILLLLSTLLRLIKK